MLKRTVSTIAVVAAATLSLSAESIAQSAQRCGPRAELLKTLSSQYKEAPVAMGLADNGSGVLEVLASLDGATWTALVTRTNGISCLVMSGENWQVMPPQSMAKYGL